MRRNTKRDVTNVLTHVTVSAIQGSFQLPACVWVSVCFGVGVGKLFKSVAAVTVRKPSFDHQPTGIDWLPRRPCQAVVSQGWNSNGS